MKRLGFLSCIIGLFLGYSSTIQAQESTTPPDTQSEICGISAPESCFFVLPSSTERKKRTGDTYPGNTDTPAHCPSIGLRGLSNNGSIAFSVLFNTLDITNTDSIDKIIELQLLLNSNTTCGGKRCAPIDETILDPDPDNNFSVTCSLEHFSDGKYGVCTKEAVRRYLEWYKVENCNIAPSLTITATPTQTTQGEIINANLSSSGGEIYEWENEDAFISKSVAPQLENIALSSSNDNVHTTFPAVTLNTDIPLTFSSTGTTNLSATGTVVGKPNLTSTSNEVPITINTSPSPPSQPNELRCNQLLPKYLVGASCDTELKGDASDITYWLQKFSGQITTFIAAIAVLLIAWNAFGLVMAAGDSDQIANGKKALMWVGIGLLLTVFAYVIVKTALSLTFLQ
jgi:hypothetical protein